MNITREDVCNAIKQTKIVADAESLRDDIELTDQGIDSLGMFNVILVLQEKYQIDIPDADIDELTTIQKLVTYLNMRLDQTL